MPASHKRTVLIIDDSEFMRSLIKSILRKYPFRVIGEADNGITGVEKYKLLKPDVVTLDLNMDEADGMTTLELIMKHNPEANVVMISAMMGQSFIIDEVKEQGAKAVVIKPIEEKALIEALMSIRYK